MSRRVELISALIASALGLTWLVCEVNALQSMWFLGELGGIGARGSQGQPVGMNGAGLYFAGMAIVMICLAAGAYLHAVQRLFSGLVVIWAAAVSGIPIRPATSPGVTESTLRRHGYEPITT